MQLLRQIQRRFTRNVQFQTTLLSTGSLTPPPHDYMHTSRVDGTKSKLPHPIKIGMLAIGKKFMFFSTKYILSRISIYITKSPPKKYVIGQTPPQGNVHR